MHTLKKPVLQSVATYVPQSIVARYVSSPGEPDISGRVSVGSLLYADVHGFTALSEKLAELGKEGAEELTSILNRYFTRMLGIVSRYGGSQLKFGGDSMFVLFEGEQHAARAVRCALMMLAAMPAFRRLKTLVGIFRLEISIGVNTGEIFEAHVGVPGERMHYLVTGREVNRLARIEGETRSGGVAVGLGTFRELRGRLDATEDPQGCYQVQRLRARVALASPFDLDRESLVDARIVERLACFLPRQLAVRLGADPSQSGVAGEHRRVTVVFVNVLGVTELIEEFGTANADVVLDHVNRYFTFVEGTVSRYGGTVVGCDLNTRGDKLLIIFGAPEAHEDDEERAVRAMLEMQERLTASGLPLRQKVGINTGYVFAGEVGSPDRKEYTVMGDHVNLAARIMGVATEGQVLVGRTTLAKIADRFATRELPPVRVKGKSEPVPIFEVVGPKVQIVAHRQLSSGRLVGREVEMAQIRSVVDGALVGQGQTLSISGPAGIGKSRLVAEMKSDWEARGGAVLTGNCQSYGGNIPYLPWTELISSLFTIGPGDDSAVRARKVEAQVADLCPQLGPWAALLGGVAHASIQESDLLKSLDPGLRHQRLLDVVLEIVQARAGQVPLLLLLEDLHWVDSASLELLAYLSRNLRAYPILMCWDYRPVEGLSITAEAQSNCTRLTLGELPQSSSLDLVRSMTGLKEIPEELSRLISANARGNPFYVEELVKSLIDTGHLQIDAASGTCSIVGHLGSVQVPDTIEGVIMSRLDQLDEQTRSVLRVASVIGRTFQYPLVREICPAAVADDELVRTLDSLTNLDIVCVGEAGAAREYYFKHALTQDVAYESLAFTDRRALHGMVGRYYETHFADDLEKYFELLSFHYGRTRDKHKALEYSVKAGDKARRLFANHDSIGYYRGALKLLEELRGRHANVKAKVEEELGDVCELVGEYDQAESSYLASQQSLRPVRNARLAEPGRPTIEEALGVSQDSRSRTARANAIMRKRAMIFERKGKYEEALSWLDRGIKALKGDGQEKASLCISRAGVLYRMGQHALALEWCQRGLEMAQQAGDAREIAHGYYLLGTINTDLGNVAQAIEHRQKALSIYEGERDLPGQARVLNNLGVDHYYLGDWEKAKEFYYSSLAIREKIGDINGSATVANNLGEVLSDQGYLDEAVESFLKCFKTWERIGYTLGVGVARSNLGRALARKGDLASGLEHLEASRDLFERLQSKGFLNDVYQRLAECYLAAGDFARARECAEWALASAIERKTPLAEGTTRRMLGQACLANGEKDKAEQLLTESLGILRKLSAPYELCQTMWRILLFGYDAEKLGGTKEEDMDMRAMLQETIAIFHQLGLRYDESRVLALSARYLEGQNNTSQKDSVSADKSRKEAGGS